MKEGESFYLDDATLFWEDSLKWVLYNYVAIKETSDWFCENYDTARK